MTKPRFGQSTLRGKWADGKVIPYRGCGKQEGKLLSKQRRESETLFLENDNMVLETWIYNDETAVTTLLRLEQAKFLQRNFSSEGTYIWKSLFIDFLVYWIY